MKFDVLIFLPYTCTLNTVHLKRIEKHLAFRVVALVIEFFFHITDM
jgi:hypothetical protein